MIRSRSLDNRIFWNPSKFETWDKFEFKTLDESVSFLKASRTRFVHDIMTSFENIPISLPDTAEILAGNYATNIKAGDYLRIRDFAKAIDMLSAAVGKQLFEFSLPALKILHRRAGRHELDFSELGQIRQISVKLGNLDYKPPVPVALNGIWERGFAELSEFRNKLEQSVIVFLWLSRTQFFVNCNKRAAALTMSGIQSANLMPCIIFPESDRRSFAREIVPFYESGNADRMIDLFREYYSQAVFQAKETICHFQNILSDTESRNEKNHGLRTKSKSMGPSFPGR